MFEKRMKNLYNTHHDLVNRLHGTIILFDGKPHLVNINNGFQLADIENYPTIEYFSVPYDDPRIDISNIELGYVNIVPNCSLNNFKEGAAVFLSRGPSKQYRQGLNYDRVVIQEPTAVEQKRHYTVIGYPISKMVAEDYPKVAEAVWNLNSGIYTSIAISREVALVKEESGVITVAINRMNVGTLIPGNNSVYVRDQEFVWVLKNILSRFNIEINPFKADGGSDEAA